MQFAIPRVILIAGLFSLLFALPASAVDKCKVSVDKKTGLISVDATKVRGDLFWGSVSGEADQTFFNEDDCVSGRKAKKCNLADPDTLAARTPPDTCTLFLDDGEEECSVWISGCTPRTGITGYEIVKGLTTSGASGTYTATADCPAGKKVIGGGGSQAGFGWFMDDSRPKLDGSGWEVQYSPDIDLASPNGIGEAWAICATVAE